MEELGATAQRRNGTRAKNLRRSVILAVVPLSLYAIVPL